MVARRMSQTWGNFARQKAPVVSVFVLLGFTSLALFAPLLPIPDPMAMDYMPYSPPSGEHWMGTDNYGRDVFARVVWGARLALQVAIVSAGLSTLLGIVLGSIAGYYGGWLDDLLGRTFDVFLLIPTFFLVILIVALFGSGIYLIMIAIAISTWPRSARIVRSQVLSVKSRAFVQATIAAGANHAQALLYHVIPNSLAPAITNGTILMGLAILTEAGLSFLGLGDPDTVSWGRMIFDAQRQLRLAPWLSFFPGLAMLLLVAALNFVGDGINSALNPQTSPRSRRMPPLPAIPTPIAVVAAGKAANEVEGSAGHGQAGSDRSIAQAAGLPVSVDSDSLPDGTASEEAFLRVDNLRVYYRLESDWLRAVDGVSLSLLKGGSLGIVGESGSGKSTLGLALMDILPENAKIVSGSVEFDGQRIVEGGRGNMSGIRWKRVSMIFQSAMNALNPVLTVGRQLGEAYRLHSPNAGRQEVRARIAELFDLVGIPRSRIESYPHELSGGMRQRVMIVFALLLKPELVIADEPTTALDVLVQDQILGEMDELRRRMGLTLILVSHDIATVAETCDQVAVMYAGQIVEQGPTKDVLENPQHPYTHSLICALPTLQGPKRKLEALPGEPFVPIGDPTGCRFAPRCRYATKLCREQVPPEVSSGHGRMSLCHYPEAIAQEKNAQQVTA